MKLSLYVDVSDSSSAIPSFLEGNIRTCTKNRYIETDIEMWQYHIITVSINSDYRDSDRVSSNYQKAV